VFPTTYNGPFTGLHGVKPRSTADLGTPLVFSHADKPRQVQFGLKMSF
jgi:hypothetical protein